MKKKLTILTFFIALCTLGFGQGMHWTQIHEMDNSMSLAAVVKIGGELQASSDIELAAFKGNVCRGTVKLTHVQMPNHNIDGYFAYLSIDGAVGENFTFKLYDHKVSEEYSLSNTVLEFNPDNSTSPFNPFEVEFIGGAGTFKDPYLIGNLDELNTFLNSVNVGNKFDGKFIQLTDDIDLTAATRSTVTNWEPIGTSENPFQGTFDGGGNTIKNLNIVEKEAKEGKAYIGFFGYAKDATIKNVVFENVNLDIACLDIDHSQGHIGAVAGSLEGNSTIEDVTVKGDIRVEATFDANGASRVAVVAGGNSYGNVTMKNVHVIANEGSYLKANNNLGALAGQLQGKNVFENCSSNIDVTGKKFFAGGIIGIAAGNSQFTNCHTTGDVTITAGREGRANDHYRVGGIAGGWADGKNNVCTLTDCSYTGQISGTNADGSVAAPLDYAGYVGRGYTLRDAGSKVVIDDVEYVQAFDNVHGLYKIDGVLTLNTAVHLKTIAEKVNDGVEYFEGKTVVLGADIDLKNENWTPIGSATTDHGFMGNFDGKTYTIKNLTITDLVPDENGFVYAGLFGVTEGTDKDNQNTIKNLTIENVTISTTGSIVAAAIAYPYYTNVENVKVCGNINITGGDYTAGVLAYTRRCVNASNLTIDGNEGSEITGNKTVGGVISDIQMNGGLTAVYNNFNAEGINVTGDMHVGGISGIISAQTLNECSVKNVTLEYNGGDNRVGIVSGSLGGPSTISNVTVENVTGATNIIGATYDGAKPIAAKIGDTYYGTLLTAVNAAKDGEIITLLADLNMSEILVINKAITLDGNGNKLTSTAGRAINVSGADGVTIQNLTIDCSGERAINVIQNATNVTIDNVTATAANYTVNLAGSAANAVVAVKNSDLTGLNVVNVAAAGAQVTVDKTVLNCDDNSDDEKYAALALNKDAQGGSIIATEVTFNIAGDSRKATNQAENGTVTIDGSTEGVEVQVAYISYGNTWYGFATIEAAIAKANDGETIEIIRDITSADKITVTKSITINGNGKTLTYTGNGAAARAIDVPSTDGVELDVTIKNLTVDCTANYCQRGINYNDDGKFTLDNVTVKGVNVTYAVNLPGSADNAEITIKNSDIAGNIALNVWGENSVVNVENTTLTAVDNSAAEGYATVKLNNDGTTSAEGTVINITGGMIDVTGSAAEDTEAASNGTSTGEINISESTVVNGRIAILVAVIRYADGNSYSFETIEDAIATAKAGETVTLLRDITVANPVTINKSITLDGTGKTLTYTGTDRAIEMPNVADADYDVTIKNLNVVATTANRGINYNDNGTLNVDNVTVTIDNTVDGYAINFPGLADGATVNIENSKLTSRNPLNIWGENMTINVTDSEITSVDGSDRYNYAAIQLNNEIPTVGPNGAIANGTVVTVTGGKITALDETGEPSFAVANATETGVVNITETTVVVGKQVNYVLNIGGAYFATLQEAIDAIEKYGYTSPIVIMKSFATSETATVKNGLNVTIDLNGKTITVTDETEKNFEAIKNQGTLTIKDSSADKTGKITVTATTNSGWNRYSAVIANTVGGKLTVDGGTLEHLGGTDMAYGIDNLTNGKGTYAETVINGGTIKSTYRGIRQFLNGVEAENILKVNGGTIEGVNKSIWMQDPNKNANTGTLTVGEEANLIGNVYLYVTPNSTSWPVEVSIAAGALAEGSEVMTANVPAGYELQQDADDNYVVNQGVAKIGDVLYATVTEAINAAENGGTVQLLALTIDEYVAPWATDTQHTSEKSITIIGAENFGTTMTGGLYLGYDDSQCREHTIVVKGINFTGKGILVASQQNVIVEGNKFTDITDRVASSGSSDKNAISINGKDVIATVKNNVITTTASVGIDLRNILTATVDGNTVTGTQHNSMQIQNASANSSAEIANNRFFDWGKSGEGRAMRINQIVTADVNNNVMINENAPEEFVKITGHTTAEIDENYWNGANPASSNTPAYFLAEGVQVHNYYAAYDEETNTLSDLVTIEGAGETLEIFYTAAGEVTEQANAAYSLMFTVTDYANNEVSVKIGSKNPAENKGCDLLIPSSVKFNDQDFAVTSIPVDGFNACKGFDKLVVPGTITSVSNSAFYNCSKLTEVVIEQGVQKLGSNTFYKISNLQTLTLPSTLTRIESLCFNGTHNIETIVCNAQTPPTAFTGCFTEYVYKNALLYVDGKYEDYKAANGWSNFNNILAVGATQTIDKDRYTLIATITNVWNRTCSVQIGTAPTNTKRAELAIPEHVSFSGIEFDITSIPEGGFQDCKYFEGTLTIPAYITSIGKNAFEGCSGVTALVVEEGVTSLGTSDTFNGCRNIETITLPSTLTKIPTRCFHNILQKLQVVECHALVPPTLASQFTQEAYNSATLYVHDVDAYKGANNWKSFKSIRLIGAVAQNKETEVEYKSIAEAVAAANAGETVQMLQNVDLENTITVAAGKEVVLDLNGKTVSYTTTEHKGEAMITNNGNLTITDTSDEETGSLSYAYEGGADSSYGFGNSTIENKGVLTINAGTVENTSAAMSHASYAINTGAGATLNVEGGNIINENGHAVRMVSFGTTLNTVNIEGGYIEGTRALQVQLPGSASAAAPEMELNITGGELKSNDETYNLAIYVYSSGQSAEDLTIKIEGGTFNGNVAIYEPSVTMEANSVVVSGGTFNGAYGIYTYGVTEADQAVISIVGGTFATNYSEWWATDDNYVFEQNENGTYSVVEQTIFTQTTQLNAGWNWFSYYVDTDLAALETALGENGVEIKSKADGFRRYDETIGWYGKLNSITSEQMYQVNTNEACSVVLEGELLDNITITLHHGWNYIGYPIGQSTSLQEALDNLTPSTNDQIKSKASGNASYDTDLQMWYGGLKTLVPGEGYMYYNSSENDVTFTYNVSRSNAELKANITTDGNYWIPNAGQYPNNMTMTAMVEVEGGDYEVAAFVNGECRGSARPIYIEAMDAHILFLTIHGEDVEEMTFRYYDLATGEEFDLNDRMNYSNDAIVGTLAEPYIFSRGTTGIGEASLSEVNIYPNPTTTGTEINLQATCDTVEVFNALGVKVAEYHNVDSIDAFETAGIYVIRLTNNGDVKHCRIVVK